MSNLLTIKLPFSPPQRSRLSKLQALFADACNSITPVVRDSRCWNRVALHHMVYRQLRTDFPDLGSQMACNVIYSVCRAARAVYQHPMSPWSFLNGSDAVLPLIKFHQTAPVYFDRHTLSLKGGVLSLFTLDGRMRVRLDLAPGDEARFASEKLREISLINSGGRFHLQFAFADGDLAEDSEVIPDHIVVTDHSVELLAERISPVSGAIADKDVA